MREELGFARVGRGLPKNRRDILLVKSLTPIPLRTQRAGEELKQMMGRKHQRRRAHFWPDTSRDDLAASPADLRLMARDKPLWLTVVLSTLCSFGAP